MRAVGGRRNRAPERVTGAVVAAVAGRRHDSDAEINDRWAASASGSMSYPIQ